MEALAERPSISPTVMRPAWKALEAHFKKIRKLNLRKLFGGNPARWHGRSFPNSKALSLRQLEHDSSTNNLIQRYRKWKASSL